MSVSFSVLRRSDTFQARSAESKLAHGRVVIEATTSS
jgi:hypothetical protein